GRGRPRTAAAGSSRPPRPRAVGSRPAARRAGSLPRADGASRPRAARRRAAAGAAPRGGERRPRALRSKRLDAQLGYAPEVLLVAAADEDRESKLQRRRRHGDVVCRNQRALLPQRCHDVGPAVGNLAPEVHDGYACDKRVDLRASSGRPPYAIGQAHADEQLGVDDRGQGERLIPQLRERRLPLDATALERNDGARVDYESHGSAGGRSQLPTRSRSSAKPGSGSPAARQAATASASVVTAPAGSGMSRATRSPFRSTRK